MVDGSQTWSTQTEWDNAQSRSGVVTRDLPARSPSDIELGFDPQHGVVADKAVHYYPLTETSGSTAEDVINGANGSIDSNTNLTADGFLGRTYMGFSETDSSQIDLGTSTLIGKNGDKSVFMVYQRNQIDAGRYTNLTLGDYTIPGFFQVRAIDSNPIKYEMFIVDGNEDSWLFRGSSSDYEVSELFPWYCEYEDGPTIGRHYVDGSFVGSTDEKDAVSRYEDTSLNAVIGNDNGDIYRWDGIIGDLLVFNSTLTQSERKSLFDTFSNGSLTTPKVTYTDATKAVEVTLDGSIPTETDVSLTLKQDTSGDGGVDHSESVQFTSSDSLPKTVSVSNFVGSESDYWITTDLVTNNSKKTPTVGSVGFGYNNPVGNVQQTTNLVLDTTNLVVDTA